MNFLPIALALLAGAASLMFELLWTRALTIEAGGPLGAFTIVICAYMAGLAAGASAVGRRADRSVSPLRMFGALQSGAGLLVLAAAAGVARGGAVRPWLAWSGAAAGTLPFLIIEILIGGGIAFLPALAMGGTLPLLVKTARGDAQHRVGLLSAANAAGGATGSILCGFVLLPALGLTRSLLATAFALMLTGAIAALAGRRRTLPLEAPPAREAAPPAGVPAATTGRAAAALMVLFVAGLAVTSMEIAWFRLAALSLGSSVRSASLVLAAVIAGLALGNAAGSLPGRVARSPMNRLSLLAACAALAAVATDPLLGRLPLMAVRMGRWLAPAGGSSQEIIASQAAQFVLMFGLVLLPCLFLGAAFPAGFAALAGARALRGPLAAREGLLAGLAAGVTSAGNLLGAPLALFGILGRAGSRGCLLAAAAGLATVAFLAAAGGASGRPFKAMALGTLALVIASSLLLSWDAEMLSSGPFLYGALYRAPAGPPGGEDFERALRERGEVIFSREGPDALVTVRRQSAGTLSMQVNGKTDASTGGDMKTQMLTAHLPLLLRPSAAPPSRVLVVGLGSGVTAAAALSHPADRVDIVEISGEVAAASRLFEQANRGATRDPRARLQIGDARTRLFFGSPESRRERWDVIASQPSNPWIAGQSLLFTREFFAAARSRLAPGGIMCQWVQGYGLDPDDFRSVAATFAAVFPHVSLWEESTAGGDYLLVGSEAPLAVDPRAIASRMARPAVAEDLRRVEISGAADLLSLHACDDASLRRFAAGAPIQTEDRLRLEFSALGALHRDTLGGILGSLEPYRTPPGALAGGDPALADALARRARAASKERMWAAGLGLFEVRRRFEGDLLEAASFLKAGMRSHAIEVLRDLTRRRPSDRLPHLMLGYLRMSAPAPALEEAIREFQTAADLDPDDPRAHLFLSRALYAAGRLDAALERNKRAERAGPALAEVHSDRCAMLLAAGDNASAEAACLEALARDPDLAEAHANLGVAQARRGRFAQAERSYRRALEIDDQLTDPRYNLAALCERQARGREGIEILQPLLSGPEGGDLGVLRLAARLALRAGERGAARSYLQRCLELEPDDPESLEIGRMLR